jgi:diacylglycerol kinase
MVRLFKSFTYAFHGLAKAFREEQNLRIESVIAIISIVLGFVFQINSAEWCLIAVAIALVFIAELVNSAIERIADALKPRINIYIKEIKDIMAAAVAVASLLAVIVGLIIFIPHILTLFH